MKICTKCNIEKPFSDFPKRSDRKSGIYPQCKDCKKEYLAANYTRNRKERCEKVKEYARENHELVKERKRDHYHKNKEQILAEKKVYGVINRKRLNKYFKDRYHNDPEYKCGKLSRTMLIKVLKGGLKIGRTAEELGYTAVELKEHLESQFQPGMSWDNHGEWHIDHIKPIVQFIREGVYDSAIINALSNLQPLWAIDNLTKGVHYAS